jgi:hypothetical protein
MILVSSKSQYLRTYSFAESQLCLSIVNAHHHEGRGCDQVVLARKNSPMRGTRR